MTSPVSSRLLSQSTSQRSEKETAIVRRRDRLTIGSVCMWGSEADVAHLGRMWGQA